MQLSASGDGGMPEVAADPQGEVAKIFQNLGICVVQQCAKIRQQGTMKNILYPGVLVQESKKLLYQN